MEITFPTTTPITVLLICAALSCWLYWLWTRRHFYTFAWKFPCVWGLPILGVFLNVGSINNVLPFLTKHLAEHKYRTFCVWLGPTPAVFTVDPKVIEQILTAPDFLEKADVFYAPVRDALSGGLIALSVKKWQHNRKIVQPTLRHKQLLTFMPIFNKKSKDFLLFLEELTSKGGGHKILNDVRCCALGMSKETTMGNTQDESPEALILMLKRLIFTIRHVSMELIFNCAHLRFLLQYNPYFHWCKKKLYDFANEIITYRSKHYDYSAEINDNSDSEEAIKTKSLIFIDQAFRYLKSGELTWTDIVGESNAILVASFETTSSTVFSTLVLLAMHPEIQERVHEEIKSLFPHKDFEVTYEDFRQLTYLEMVINETMRLLPPAPLIARQTTKDAQLIVDDYSYKVPRDIALAISIYHLQREPSIWGPAANEFNPDHFLPQKVAERHPYTFLPFSKGPRNCAGWTYAYFTMKVLLAHILRNYKITTNFKYQDIRVNLSLFLEYREEPKLSFQKRN